MYSFQLFKSNKKNKKYEVIIYKNKEKIKTLHFGDSRYKDFIIKSILKSQKKESVYI